jgi:hypothetical protein
MTAVTGPLRFAALATGLLLACGVFAIQSVAMSTPAQARFPTGTFTIKSVGKVGTCAQDVGTSTGKGEVHMLLCTGRSNQSWEAIGGMRLRNLITERCITIAPVGESAQVVTDKSCGTGIQWQWRFDNTATHDHIVGPGQLCWKSRTSGVTVFMSGCSTLDVFEDFLLTVL